MKIILSLCLVVLLIGCGGLSTSKVDPQEVVIKVQADSQTKVKIGEELIKSMEVKNPEGSLSNYSFIYKDTGYLKLYGTLTSYDSVSVWNDLILFEKVYKIKDLNIYISSGGGGAFSGLGLADDIERISTKLNVIAHASGIVASAAVPVFASAKKRVASKGAIFMVHQAKSFKYIEEAGEKDAVAEVAMFKLLKKRYLEKLASHSKLSANEWLTKLEEITWFDAVQAKEWGLVDEIE